MRKICEAYEKSQKNPLENEKKRLPHLHKIM